MAENENSAEQYAHLPDHPGEPFLRIVGNTIGSPRSPGDPCHWGLGFHVVFPNSPRPARIVRARIREQQDGPVVREQADVFYPKGPCVSQIDLFDSRVYVDREVPDVLDVSGLPPGDYWAEAELYDEGDTECGRDGLPFRVGPPPVLRNRIELVSNLWRTPGPPSRYLAGQAYSGDIDGDGVNEYVHVVCAVHMAAYRENGELLWRYDDPDGARGYGSSAMVWDVDGDGVAEIVCARGAFGNVRLCVIDGATGRVRKEIEYPLINRLEPVDPADPSLSSKLFEQGHLIRVVEDLHMIGGYVRPANFRGRSRGEDILLQAGEQNCVTMVALTSELEELWRYRCENGRAGHIPDIGDVDGDGCDELALGTELIDHDGTRIWELPFEAFAAPWEDDHVDMSAIGDLDGDGKVEIAYSSRLVVEAESGRRRWIDPTWHGQTVRVGKLRNDVPGLQIAFNDREYRHSRHFIHGSWMDVRDADGNRLWDRRFQSMHPFQFVDWLNDGTLQVAICSDLQRFAPQPNLQIFDGYGRLVDVIPSVTDPHETPERSIPGQLIQHPYAPFPRGSIDVYARG